MEVREVEAKGIVTRSDLPDADYVVNPYTGCQHACDYCYAKFMGRFADAEGDWGEFVHVKTNAVDVFEDRDYSGDTVLFSSVTDPYQQVESEYELTRDLLCQFVGTGAAIEVLTKSALVTRDVDVFRTLDDVQVAVSLGTLDPDLSNVIEPYASSPRARLDAIEDVSEAGLRTYVFVSPIFPFLTDLTAVVDEVERRGCADEYLFEPLNLTRNRWTVLGTYLEDRHPDLADAYEEIYFGDREYWPEKVDEIRELCEARGLDYTIYTH